MSSSEIYVNYSELPPALLIEALQDANLNKYLGAIGLVVLSFDHALTFSEEVRLVWRAPGSYAKYVFLLNRYMVVVSLLLVAIQQSAYTRFLTTTAGCQALMSITSMLAIFSIGIANILVLMRVVLLWEGNKTVTKLLVGGFFVSFGATVGSMIYTLITLFDGILYNPESGMCGIWKKTPALIAVWASPMLFEILVLGFTCWNALSRPRHGNTKIIRQLHHDGIVFFLALTTLRIVDIVFAAAERAALTFAGMFFVWAMTTVILNRSLLRVRRAEVAEQRALRAAALAVRATSPFGISPASVYGKDDEDDEYEDDEDDEEEFEFVDEVVDIRSGKGSSDLSGPALRYKLTLDTHNTQPTSDLKASSLHPPNSRAPSPYSQRAPSPYAQSITSDLYHGKVDKPDDRYDSGW